MVPTVPTIQWFGDFKFRMCATAMIDKYRQKHQKCEFLLIKIVSNTQMTKPIDFTVAESLNTWNHHVMNCWHVYKGRGTIKEIKCYMKTVIWESGFTWVRDFFWVPNFSECSDRSKSVRNRKLGFLRIDIDLQIFIWIHLSKKLEQFQIRKWKKSGFPHRSPYKL